MRGRAIRNKKLVIRGVLTKCVRDASMAPPVYLKGRGDPVIHQSAEARRIGQLKTREAGNAGSC